MTAIICPICDHALESDEGLVIRPINNGTGDNMRVLHVKYGGGGRVLHDSDNYTRLAINY